MIGFQMKFSSNNAKVLKPGRLETYKSLPAREVMITIIMDNALKKKKNPRIRVSGQNVIYENGLKGFFPLNLSYACYIHSADRKTKSLQIIKYFVVKLKQNTFAADHLLPINYRE